jgi:flavodoxin
VYDSIYGNTEKVARAIAEAVRPGAECEDVRADEADVSTLRSVDLLIVGSPTHGGRPTAAMKGFLDRVPANGLANIPVTAFDTRMTIFIARLFGYAAGRIAASLKRKGGLLSAAPVGFIVEGREGPLRAGELERAAAWGAGLVGGKRQAA